MRPRPLPAAEGAAVSLANVTAWAAQAIAGQVHQPTGPAELVLAVVLIAVMVWVIVHAKTPEDYTPKTFSHTQGYRIISVGFDSPKS